jgi:hypothetical protein
MPRSALFLGSARQQINFCSGSKNRCTPIDIRTTIVSATAWACAPKVAKSGQRPNRATHERRGSSAEASFVKEPLHS